MDVAITETRLIKHDRRMQRGYWKRRSRIHVFPEGETIMENLANRRSRPIKLYRRVAEEALGSLGVNMGMVDFRWSQKAGCSCGCSPGFVVDGFDQAFEGSDVYVTIRGLEAAQD